MKKICGLSTLIVAATMVQDAGAAPVTYDFTASVPPITGIGPSAPLTGRFTYDDAGLLIAATPAGTQASYRAARSVSFDSSVGADASMNGDGPGSLVQVSNFPSQDSFLFTVAGGFAGNGIAVDIRFTDGTGTVFDGTSLPAFLNLADFSSATISYTSYAGSASFSAPITSLSLVPSSVPEPAAWAAMLAGMGAVGAAVRRRRPSPAPSA